MHCTEKQLIEKGALGHISISHKQSKAAQRLREARWVKEPRFTTSEPRSVYEGGGHVHVFVCMLVCACACQDQRLIVHIFFYCSLT